MNIEKSRLSLHFLYTTVILIFCLILVATDRWTDKSNFTEYLTNVATMVSLVLALVAIFYSFVSNVGLSQSLGNIASVSESVQATNQQIVQFVGEATKLNHSNNETASKLESVSKDIGTTVLDLRGALENISLKTSELHDAVSVLPSRMTQLETKLETTAQELKSTNGAINESAKSAEPPSDSQAKRFMERSPLIANLMMYACVLAQDTEIPLSLEEFIARTGILSTTEYFQGYLVCMWASGLVSRKPLTEQGPRIYAITEVHETLRQQVKSHMQAHFESEFSTKPKTKERWLKRLATVEEMFGKED